MPADILTTDTLFPELNGGESTDQKFEMVTDYLWLLREQLTYALTNLGIANFNQTQLGKLSGIIAEPLKVVLAEQETQFTAFGVELGKIGGRITDVEKVVTDEDTGLVQKMAQFELQADGYNRSFTEIGKVLNGEDGKSGLVKDVADVAGNYISKSAVTQTAEGFELEVVGTNSSGVEQTRMKMTADGLKIYNKAGVAVLDFDTNSGDLEVQGTITGSEIYGSVIQSVAEVNSGTEFLLISGNSISGMKRYNKTDLLHGISILPTGDFASIDFSFGGKTYFTIGRNSSTGSNLPPITVGGDSSIDIVSRENANSDSCALSLNYGRVEMFSSMLVNGYASTAILSLDGAANNASIILQKLVNGSIVRAGIETDGEHVGIICPGGFFINGTQYA